MPARRTQAEAVAWITKLSRPSVDNDDLRAFFAWRRIPANQRAFDAETKARRRRESRFVSQPDAQGYSVVDTTTGEPAVFANRAQTGISERDADDIAEILNRRALSADLGPAHSRTRIAPAL